MSDPDKILELIKRRTKELNKATLLSMTSPEGICAPLKDSPVIGSLEGRLRNGESFVATFTMSLGNKEILIEFDRQLPFEVLSIFVGKSLHAHKTSLRFHNEGDVQSFLGRVDYLSLVANEVNDGYYHFGLRWPDQVEAVTTRGFGWVLVIVEE